MTNRTALIAQPNLYIGDVTGRPVDLGRVYFGEANKDPEFYPIDIFYDKELMQPALQPIRTKGGFLYANGDLVQIYSEQAEYSVKVLDQYGREVFYKASLAKPSVIDIAADNIDYLRSLVAPKVNDLQSAIDVIKAGNLLTSYVYDGEQTQAQINAAQKQINNNQGQINATQASFLQSQTQINSNQAQTNTNLLNSINAGASGHKGYATLALAQAAQASLTANTLVEVTNDTTTANNGVYLWNGTTLTKSTYDPKTVAVADAKSYTDSKATETRTNLLKIESVNVISGITWTDGSFLNTNGSVGTYSGFSYSDYIPVDPLLFSYTPLGRVTISSGNASTVFYDANKQVISGVLTSTLPNNAAISVPSSARFMRVSISTSDKVTFVLLSDSLLHKKIANNLLTKPSALTITDVRRNADNSTGSLPSKSLYSLEIKNTNHFVKSVILQTAKGTTLIGEMALYEFVVGGFKKVRKLCDVYKTTTGESLIDFSEQPVFVASNQFLGVYENDLGAGNTGVLQYGSNANYPAYYLTNVSNLSEGQTFTTSYNVNVGNFKLAHTLNYMTADNSSVSDNVEAIKTGIRNSLINVRAEIDSDVAFATRKPYVSVFHDNFKSASTQWLQPSNTWVVDNTNGTVTPTATGGSIWNTSTSGVDETNTFKLNKKYEANRREASFRVSFKADTVIEIALVNQWRGNPDGNWVFRLDVPNKKLTRVNIWGVVQQTVDITMNLVADREYVLLIGVDRLNEHFSIVDYITGERNDMTYVMTVGGNQCQYYTLALKSGSPFTLREADVAIMRRPKVYIVGDSITAYQGSAVSGWAYKLTDALNGSVVISARGNDDASSIPELFDNEVKHIKPEILMWCHGHNGEKIQASRLDEVKALCDQYGIVMYVNRGTCKYRDEHIRDNNIIDTKNFKGARFDIATARDSNPYLVSGDTTLRADASLYSDVSIHPNELGHQKMWERFAIDMPEIFK